MKLAGERERAQQGVVYIASRAGRIRADRRRKMWECGVTSGSRWRDSDPEE